MKRTPIKKQSAFNYYLLIMTPLFFIAFFLVVWLLIEPVLYYQRQEPVFFFGFRFFNDFLSYPGGLVEYAAAFLAQFYHFSWAGALIITLIVWLISLNTQWLIRAVTGAQRIEFLHFIPPILLLGMHIHYQHPLAISLALLITLLVTNLYLWFAPKELFQKIVLYLFLVAGLYYTTAGPFFLFALTIALFEGVKKRHYLHGILYAVVAAVLPYLATRFLFIITLKQAYLNLLPLDVQYIPRFLPHVLYLYFVIIALWGVMVPATTARKSKRSHSKITLKNSKFSQVLTGKIRYIIQPITLLVLAVLMIIVAYSKPIQTMLKIDYLAHYGRWQELLEISKNNRPSDRISAFHTNRALFHTGRLPDEFFTYPQFGGVDNLFLPTDYSFEIPLQKSDLYFELGHINEAEHWASEALAVRGYTPWNLQRIALTNLLKSRLEVVRKCLNHLDKTVFYRDWARHYRPYLDNPTLVAADRKLQQIRELIPNSDFIVRSMNPEFDLIMLLKSNKYNKMAYEYLMAYYLLTRQLGKFYENLKNVSYFNYGGLPRHFEEALLIYVSNVEKGDLSLSGRGLGMQTFQAYRHFQATLRRYQGNKTAAYPEIMQKFGHTYWAYLMYQPTGSASKE